MGFFAPWLLPLVGLASLPVIIHILSQLRLQRRPFPSLLLLSTVKRERFSWLKLKELLLLILRTLALAALLLVLSRPYLLRRLPGLSPAEDFVLVLDDSYSMTAGSGWSAVLERARRLVESSGPGRRFCLLTASGLEIAPHPGAKQDALNLLDTLRPFALAPTLDRALIRAASLAESLRAPVTVITDLQERTIPSGWRVPQGISVTLEDVSDWDDNAGIARVFPEHGFVRLGRANRIRAELANYSGRKQVRTLTLDADGLREERVVELAPYERRIHTFETELSRPGRYAVLARLSQDSLETDDRRFLVLTIEEETPILVVESQRVPGRYVNQALSADSAAGFKLDVIASSDLSRVNLSRYRAVIATDAFAFTTADWNRLDFYLRSGGACLLMAGPPLSDMPKLGPYVESKGAARPAGFLSVTSIDTTHPTLAGLVLQAFSSTHVTLHSRLVPGTLRVLARLTDSEPLILESKDNRTIIWSIGPGPEFSDLVYRAVFVPLLYQTVGYLSRGAIRQEFIAGDTIRLRLDRGGPAYVSTPAGRIRVEPTGSELALTDTRIPGIYSVEPEREEAHGHVAVVNPLPDEGDLTAARPERLKAQGFIVSRPASAQTADLSLPLLYLAAALFCCEMLLLLLERANRRRPVLWPKR